MKKTQLTSDKSLSFSAYLEQMLAPQEYLYVLFGFYMLTATYASLYLLPNQIIDLYPRLYVVIQYSVTLVGTSFLLFPIWPSQLLQKHVLAWIWPLSSFYTLFLVGAALVVMSGFASTQLLLFMLNFVMAALLFYWPLAVGMAVSGVLLAGVLFNHYIGLADWSGDGTTPQFRLAYGLLVFSSFLIALFKQRQAYDALQKHNAVLTTARQLTQEELVKAVHHEARFFTEVTTAGNAVLEAVTQKVANFSAQAQQAANSPQLATLSKAVQEVNQSFHDAMEYARSVIYRTQSHLRLEVNTVSLADLLAETLAVLKAQEVAAKPQPRIENVAHYQELECDASKIQQLLVNALHYAQQNSDTHQPVLLGIQATTLGYPLPSVKNYIKEVAALCITVTSTPNLPRVKVLYMGTMGNVTFQLPRSAKDLVLLDNQRIVDAHYGAVELSKTEQGLAQIYVIPLHLREVRPPMMDVPQMEIGGVKEKPQAIRPEETALLARLQSEAPTINLELVEKALQCIKKYYRHDERNSEEPLYLHPIAATEILLNHTQDPAAVLATLLHDAIENTPLTLAELGVIFGPEVAAIVNKLTHLEGQLQRVSMDAHENIRQLLDEEDVRV
ncbi:MAG: HD domain-containing protein, partial [Bacteroidota bacterium]